MQGLINYKKSKKIIDEHVYATSLTDQIYSYHSSQKYILRNAHWLSYTANKPKDFYFSWWTLAFCHIRCSNIL